MGYQIHYEPGNKMQRKATSKNKISVLFSVFLSLFIIITFLFWPQGRTALQSILIPGDPEVTMCATDMLISSLKNGTEPGEALETFCLSILDGAQFAVH